MYTVVVLNQKQNNNKHKDDNKDDGNFENYNYNRHSE